MMIWLVLNNSTEGYLVFFLKKNKTENFRLNKKRIVQYIFPRAPIFEESALDKRFHICVVKSYHYRTTGEMPQIVNNIYV